MKNIKYWQVKLYQRSQQSPLISLSSNGTTASGVIGSLPLGRLIAEGYSIDRVDLPHRDGFISLLTDPHSLELKTFRADVVDSIVCTPVYEGEEEAKADSDAAAAKGRYNYDTFKDASKPLIQWLNENANPHASVIVDCTGAELLTGEIAFNTKEFLKD
ncbi:hypothetical protein ABKV83_11615 [Enterobacter asburiae]|uniref:hypothetical protein n=1 Tax=Enterobacter asburiae TaxID=61645 RepID=UPI0032AED27D